MRVTLFTYGGPALISRLVVTPDTPVEARPTAAAPNAPLRRRRLSGRARAILASAS